MTPREIIAALLRSPDDTAVLQAATAYLNNTASARERAEHCGWKREIDSAGEIMWTPPGARGNNSVWASRGLWNYAGPRDFCGRGQTFTEDEALTIALKLYGVKS